MRLTKLIAKRKDDLLLVVLVFYVAFLCLGTVGELFHIPWILSLPIFRPPG